MSSPAAPASVLTSPAIVVAESDILTFLSRSEERCQVIPQRKSAETREFCKKEWLKCRRNPRCSSSGMKRINIRSSRSSVQIPLCRFRYSMLCHEASNFDNAKLSAELVFGRPHTCNFELLPLVPRTSSYDGDNGQPTLAEHQRVIGWFLASA